MLNRSIVIVIGPTPPGTGVIREAISFTASKSTSPTSLKPVFFVESSILFTPTSITTAPGLTMSAVTVLGRPAAAIIISARLVWAAMFFVLVWQMVTVALPVSLFWISMFAIGLPTMLLRPMTTTSAPSVFTPLLFSNWIMPLGVQGRKAFSPATILPMFVGWKPSTSFSGFIARSTFDSSMCFGRGSWTSMPLILGSLFIFSTKASRSSSEVSAGRRLSSEKIPISSQAFSFAVT